MAAGGSRISHLEQEFTDKQGEKPIMIMWQWIKVEDIMMNSCLA